MAGQCWTAAVHHAQLQMALAGSPSPVSSSSSSSEDSGSSVVIAPSVLQSTKLELAGRQNKTSTCRHLQSSIVSRTIPPTDGKVTSAGTSAAATQCSSAEEQSFYGQILTQALLQNAKAQQSTDMRTIPSFLGQPKDVALTSATPVILQPASSALQSGNIASFVRVIMPEHQSVMTTEGKVLTSHPNQPSGLLPSLQTGYSTEQMAFPLKDGALGCPVSSSSLSPNHFLGKIVTHPISGDHTASLQSQTETIPSSVAHTAPLQSQTVSSPAGVGHTASPDTTQLAVLETDSGYSDNFTDKSASPDKRAHAESVNISPTKRKRVRKSRAKQQDPELKVMVKKTRRVRANDRERTRMHGLNDAMDELRKHLPNDGNAGKLTKIDTLRTASNYIKVLKMMLGEMEKGEDVTQWSADMVTAVNNLYVQPAASPDSTGMISPSPHNFSFHDGQQLQNCVSSGVAGEVMMSTAFSAYPSQACGLADNFGTVSSMSGVLPCGNGQMPGSLAGPNNNVAVLGDSTNYNPLNDVLPSNYNSLSGFAPALNSGYSSQQYAPSAHCTSTQSIFLQSSPCY